MDEIQKYLTEELQSAKEEKENLEEQIHKIEIETELICQAIDKIVMNQDATSLVFMSEEEFQGFDGTEIKKLSQKKTALAEEKLRLQQTVSQTARRIAKLERLLKQNTGKLKEDSTGAKKVYNTYEVIYMQEADRQRIARDIHDTVVQGLTALIHKNEFVGKIFETDKQRAQLELKKNNNVIRDSINELRNIIFDLRPMSLDDLGFEKTFYTAIEKIKGTTQMVVKADYLCDTDSMNPIIGITVIRIIQELCSNSIKYSKGTRIQVTIKQDKQNELLILYSDNGEGYDLNKPTDCTKNNTGFGLNMMRERIALLQGKMEVCYKDGELSYTIRIPLDTQASDGYECLNLINKTHPDVVLLDINMPNLDGLQVLSIMKQQKMKSKVIMLTIHKDVDYLIEALDAGCDGYVLKDSDSETLKKAIFDVYNGETFIEPSLTVLLNSSLAERDVMKDKLSELTKREVEVLKLIASGMFNKEIASTLCISERTVKNHVSNIFKKIEVSDRTQAAVFAIKNNLVDIK